MFAPSRRHDVLTKIRAAGGRTNTDVPFPAGAAVDAFNNLCVSAFSVAPESRMGIPGVDSSGQVWRLRFRPDSPVNGAAPGIGGE
jgi:hypothetical protein